MACIVCWGLAGKSYTVGIPYRLTCFYGESIASLALTDYTWAAVTRMPWAPPLPPLGTGICPPLPAHHAVVPLCFCDLEFHIVRSCRVCLSVCACLIALNAFWGHPCCHTWQESFVFEIWVVFLCHLFFICSTLDGHSLSIFFWDAGISAALNMENRCLYIPLAFLGCMLSTGDCWSYGDGVLCLIVGESLYYFPKMAIQDFHVLIMSLSLPPATSQMTQRLMEDCLYPRLVFS